MSETSCHSDLRPGDTVGEYRVVGPLGEGGMGKVYSGVHPLIGRKVAIKVISVALSRSDEGTARFLQEARAASALRHRNIVDVFAFGQLADGRHYQVMELLEGENLGHVLAKRGPLPLAQTRVVTRAILSALDAAHKHGIIHRDIKPDNVFVRGNLEGPLDDLEVKILDFGLAKQHTPPEGIPAVVTRLGFPMGTPAYMSPEQCRGVQTIDARADVYAAGVVLYEMITGRVPFWSDAALEVMTMQIGQPPPSPSTLTPVPLALETVVLRALAKEPGQRFESASEMLAAFEAACRATPDWRPTAARPPQLDPQLAMGATLPSSKMPRSNGMPSVSPGFLTPTSMAELSSPERSSGRSARSVRLRRLLLLVGAVSLVVLFLMKREKPLPEAQAPVVAVRTVAPSPAPPPPPRTSTLRVALTPAGRVYLDGRFAGAGAEIEIADVSSGDHALRAEAPGHRGTERRLTVAPGESAAIALVLQPRRPVKRSKVARKDQEVDLEAPINPYKR